MREVGPKNMHFFTVIEKFVKIKIVYSFLAITASFFIFHQNKKKFATVTLIISENFCFILFPSNEFHVFDFSTDFKNQNRPMHSEISVQRC